MRDDDARSKAQSLGELITALRPGDPCPWCGERLQRGAGLTRVGEEMADTDVERLSSDDLELILTCPECRSQVCGARTTVRGRRRASLSVAA
jgi:hypothetical protein